MAWLLGSWRLLADGGRFAHRSAFLDPLMSAGVPCDPPRVSRWESGSVAAPGRVVAGYERVLGLAPYQLRGAIDLVAADGRPVYGLELTEPASGDRLGEVLETVFDGAPTGLQWLELAQRMQGVSTVYLRSADWSSLCGRLLAEQAAAVGVEHTARAVALAVLLGIPAAQPHVVRCIGSLVLDGPAPDRAGAVRLLSLVPHPHTAGLTVRLLDSDELDVRTGAAHALAAMLADDTFEATMLDLAQRRLVAGLRRDPDDLDLADAAARLPGERRTRVAEQTRNAQLAHLIATHETVPPKHAAAVSTTIARAAQRRLGSADHPDETLRIACREALFHGHHRRRFAAQALLAASPYGEALAEVERDLDGEMRIGRPSARLLPPWAT